MIPKDCLLGNHGISLHALPYRHKTDDQSDNRSDIKLFLLNEDGDLVGSRPNGGENT